MDKLLQKLTEPSTYKGIILIAGVLGTHFNPDVSNQVVALCIALFGLIEVYRTEHKTK